jgi:ubiquinone/menaquinone biosynthesis C-methylase UbiE
MNLHTYYANNRWWNEYVTEMHRELYQTILRTGPKRVLEFGCGGGKNLAALEGVEVWGVDINVEGVITAIERRGLEGVFKGSEKRLWVFGDKVFDVAFTCSVLDHVKDGKGLVEQLKRVAQRVVVNEADEVPKVAPDPNWWVHPYSEMGFKHLSGPYSNPIWANIPYSIWEWK